MSTGHNANKQLKKMLTDPAGVLIDPGYWHEPVCHCWLEHVSDCVRFNEPAALKRAIFGVRLARRVVLWQDLGGCRSRCVLAQAFAVLGSAYRALGKLTKASHALDKAVELAARCSDPDERSNVIMRRALLCVYEARRSDGTFDQAIVSKGLALAERALDEAHAPVAQARALNARGHLQTCAGDHRAGIRDAQRALELIDPPAHTHAHISAISLLIWALSFGEKADREEAIAHIEKLRAALPSRNPVPRARLLWAEALIYAQDPRRKPRARHRLDQARRKFLTLKMQAEAIAVTADQAQLDPMGPISKLCTELLAILPPGPIRMLVEALRSAHVMQRRGLAERLRQKVQAPGLLPAPA